ncbi:MAG: PQQ-dependent sugar dehydrogenase [Dehalococcoidia bacterium]|nr:PQQ-dependent sugar dehydrogenase [Dehalococcoidia bacterium]
MLGLLVAAICAGCIDAESVLESFPTPDSREASPFGGLLPTVTPLSEFTPPPTITPMPKFEFAPTITPMAKFEIGPTVTPLPTFTLPPTITPIPKWQGFGQEEPLRKLGVVEAFPGLSFDRPVAIVFPNDGTGRGFVVEQPGRIVALNSENDSSTFLDIRDRVRDRGEEEGLLGLAFDPDYESNGFLYVYYTADGPRRSVISRFSVDPGDQTADPGTETLVLEVEQPYANHNGGQIVFGPDDFLYVGLGDGGSAGDPKRNGQNLATLLGTILRLDVSTLDSTGSYTIPADNPFVGERDARPEIWAYGLRNPWRFTFDSETGDLWAADVGQKKLEEVDLIRPGLNYGWNIMEGDECYPRSCDTDGLELPVAVYGRDGGCSITGGYVYRGSQIPSLYGAYVYGDFCSGKIWAFRYDGSRVTESILLADTKIRISSFGEDATGELYILDLDGEIYRFVE